MPTDTATILYHNPSCGASRRVLAMLRAGSVEPTVIEYLKTLPTRAELVSLLQRMRMTPRQILHRRGALYQQLGYRRLGYQQLGLADETRSDDSLIDALLLHPILMESPIVVTADGVRLCRSADAVPALLEFDRHAP